MQQNPSQSVKILFNPTRQIVFTLVLLLTGSWLYGQKMLWSTPQKITSKNYFTEIIGQNSAGLYYYQSAKNETERNITIIGVTHSLKARSKKLLLPNNNEFFIDIAMMNNNLLLFYALYDKKTGETDLMVKLLDPDLNSPVEDKSLGHINLRDFNDKIFRIVAGRKRDKVLVMYPSDRDSLNNHLNCILLDQNARNLANSRLDIPFNESLVIRQKMLVGECLYMAIHHTEKIKSHKQELQHLLKFDVETGVLKSNPLFSDEVKVFQGKMMYNNAFEILEYNAFYYTEDSLKPKGFYRFVMYPDKDSIAETITDYPVQMIDELFGKNARNPRLQNLYLMKSIPRSDGGIIYISEKKEIDAQQMNDVSVYGVPHNYVRYYYYYYEISILSFNPDGSYDWHKTIKKEQISLNDEGYYSSFGCEITKDGLYFIYNDLSRKTSNIVLYSVNPNGIGSGDILIKGREFEGYAIPRESFALSGTELLVPMVKLHEGFTLLKLDFE